MKRGSKKSSRLGSIDLLRVLAILMVIFFHTIYQLNHDGNLRSIGFMGISLFFIISGFLLAKKYPKTESFNLRWFLKRYFRVAILYYLALVVISFLFSSQVYSGSLLKNLIYHFVFLDFISSSTAYGIISPAWFLIPLLGLYLLFPWLNSFIKKNWKYLFVAFIIMDIVRIMEGTYTSYCPLFFLGEFCFGIAFAHNIKGKALGIALLSILVHPMMFISYLIFYGFSFVKIKGKLSNYLGFIGTNTFALFLFHESFIKVATGKWSLFSFSKYGALLILTFVFTGVVYISKGAQKYFLEKFKCDKC